MPLRSSRISMEQDEPTTVQLDSIEKIHDTILKVCVNIKLVNLFKEKKTKPIKFGIWLQHVTKFLTASYCDLVSTIKRSILHRPKCLPRE